ncbi:MAG: GtrA family protein [Paludibacter sp.]|nr:GtrA family protein [Paludibacter sp.]
MPEIKKKSFKEKQTAAIDKLFVFTKAQISALIGGVSDYAIMVFVTEVFHVHYTISIAIGGVVGAVVNFGLNKSWTFRSKNNPYRNNGFIQLFKFILVVLNSIFLKSSGTYIITSYFGLDYKISRIFIDIFVSVVFNYTFQRFWVFKKVN